MQLAALILLCGLAWASPVNKRFIFTGINVKNTVNNEKTNEIIDRFTANGPIFGGYKSLVIQDKTGGDQQKRGTSDEEEKEHVKRFLAILAAIPTIGITNINIEKTVNNKVNHLSESNTVINAPIFGGVQRNWNHGRRQADPNAAINQMIQGIIGNIFNPAGPSKTPAWLAQFIQTAVGSNLGKRGLFDNFKGIDVNKLLAGTTVTDGHKVDISGQGNTVIDLGNGCHMIKTNEGFNTVCGQGQGGHVGTVVEKNSTSVDGNVTSQTEKKTDNGGNGCREVKHSWGTSTICTSTTETKETKTDIKTGVVETGVDGTEKKTDETKDKTDEKNTSWWDKLWTG